MTAEEWAKYIGAAIEAAEADGYIVEKGNDCRGCCDSSYIAVTGHGEFKEVLW